MLNNSQGKKQEVEEHRRNVKISKNKMSVTACNDSLKANTSNVNFVYATCGKCVLNVKHDMCVLQNLNGMTSRTKMPIVVPACPKRTSCSRIHHQTSVARTPEQNGVVERQNRTLVEATRTMLSAAKVPLFFWAEVIATACFTQNHSLVIPRHEKTPYHIINHQKLSVKFFYIFGYICYIVRDGENLDKMKEKGDECIFVGYSTKPRAYRVFNKRTRVIMESIHVNFDELPQMASVQNSSDPAPTRQSMASAHNSSDPAPKCQTKVSVQISSDPAPVCQTMALEHGSLSPGRNCQENVSHTNKTDTTSNELDLLFSPMFDELLNGSTKVMSKSSTVSVADAPNQRQQPTTPLNNQTIPAPTCQNPPITTSVISSENINQAEPHAENAQVADDEF
nr:retrovirus-related Pol polyprotein from transposon TNT 1-94 [Tanacetum cinerariifolium]